MSNAKIAVLERVVNDIEERQEAFHKKFGEIHSDIGLMRLDMQRWGLQTQQLIVDQSETRNIITNNTAALNSIQNILNNLITERNITKTNIGIFGKITLWVGGVFSMFYTLYTTVKNWKF